MVFVADLSGCLCAMPILYGSYDWSNLQATSNQRYLQRRTSQIRASTGPTISSNDFRPGVTLELDGAPWRVVGARMLLKHGSKA